MSKGYIKFWGVRGSNPAPDKDKIKYGGDTSCVEVRSSKNDVIILDMGSGLRNLGIKILSDPTYPKVINIFISHFHWDHVMGFLYFTPLYDDSFTFNIYGNNKHTSTSSFSKKILDPGLWPVSIDMLKAKINFYDLDGSDISISATTNVSYTNHTHPNGATSYRINMEENSVTYTTDCEHPKGTLNKNVLSIAENTDYLIHDCHFSKKDLELHRGWGHSCWEDAANVAMETKAKNLILFHYSPTYTDIEVAELEKKALSKFPNTRASKQGLKINL